MEDAFVRGLITAWKVYAPFNDISNFHMPSAQFRLLPVPLIGFLPRRTLSGLHYGPTALLLAASFLDLFVTGMLRKPAFDSSSAIRYVSHE